MSSQKPSSTCKPWYFLATLSLVVFIQSALVTGVLSADITTIEKRFGFRSSQSGALFSIYDASVLVVVVPLSHLGSRWNVPKALGLGTFVMGLGSFLMAIPHFLVSDYHASNHDDLELCAPFNSLQCTVGSHDALYALFVVAQVVIGFGAATLYTLGPLYLDKVVSPAVYPLYLGIYYSVAAIGPAFGYIGGSQSLTVYVDYPKKSIYTSSDSQWLGAWWIPFLACGAWAVLAAVPLFFLPPTEVSKSQNSSTHNPLPEVKQFSSTASKEHIIPSAAKWAVEQVEVEGVDVEHSNAALPRLSSKDGGFVRMPEIEESSKPLSPSSVKSPSNMNRAPSATPPTHLEHKDSRPSGVNPRVRRTSSALEVPETLTDSMPTQAQEKPRKPVRVALREVFQNRVFLFNSLAQCVETLVVSAFSAFLPKFLTTQFGLTDSAAGSITGLVVIPGAAGGILLGGYLMKHFRLSVEQTARLCVFSSILAALMSTSMLIGCSELQLAGVTAQYHNNDTTLLAECNLECDCVRTLYDPVCGADGIVYYSPCYAGCSIVNTSNGDRMFHNCSCVGDPVGIVFLGEELPAFGARSGTCGAEGSCSTKLALFLVALFILMVFTFLSNSPAMFVMIRTLGDNGPVGLSVNSLNFRLLGGIPGPVLFGAMLDRACEATNTDCGNSSCEVYDVATMRAYFFLLGFIGKSISMIFFGLSWRATKDMPVTALGKVDMVVP
eukprot:c45399_g1_i1.p1 GENE.c45399_g1_i1~~c45399_g1_i1.p1  ORF type:complete len:721 (-),score=153.61 c45399_g1_i1:97-2259(-)